MDNVEFVELMERLKGLNNEEIDRVIKYCKILKKANDVKEGRKPARRKRTKGQ
ncbi:hypothetical protein [Fonticella tunisiensis]|uniref:Uncharacterized protein n=1 Tax=Fonticella tunisiensis TaxID=1096341 RepID=A0A4V3EU56_9CLOT|nr:hypothetical protein [Fonticella tunisiensis]TDT61999.1 hypothetical protein EDD71_105180 [Fonticella tunisiensis]